MTRRIAAGILAGILATLLSTVDAEAARPAGTAGYCPDSNGVTVIVDFQELGGTTIIRCAPGPQPTGLAALRNAGIQVTGTQRWGDGFVCRLEGKPEPEADACVNTPPASAYWSYWHSPDGGAWKYSEWGVLNRTPPPGSFEGWSFSLDRTSTTNSPPRIAPRRPTAPPPPANPPPPEAAPRPAPAPGGPGPAPKDAAPVPAPGTPGGAPATTGFPVASSTVPANPSSSPAPVSGSAGGVDWTGDLEPAAAQAATGGSPTGLLVGAALVLVLTVGAGLTMVRRKRSRP